MNAIDGSRIAKGGFNNEKSVIDKFNNWRLDRDAQSWIKDIGYDIYKIKSLNAIKGTLAKKEIEKIYNIRLGSTKTDARVCIVLETKKDIYVHNLQIKLVSNKEGLNQIDKRAVKKYIELWDIPENVSNILKRFTGEILPVGNVRDPRRMFMDEFTSNEQHLILNFLRNKKEIIINDIIRGRNYLQAEWMLVIQIYNNQYLSIIKPINFVIEFFGYGDVKISPKGSINIGKILMQRKGGDGGRESAKNLQFKFNPANLLK